MSGQAKDHLILCELCDNVEQATRKLAWYRWCCLVSPKQTPNQFVVAEPFLTEPPFKLCRDVNPMGECALFEERKNNAEHE